MARLDYVNLPENIKDSYKSKEIYKITKQSATIISVYLTNHQKKNWRKRGQNWEPLNSDAENE